MLKVWCNLINILPKRIFLQSSTRAFSATPRILLKSVVEEKTGDEIVISGENKPSTREGRVLPRKVEGSCPICSLDMKIEYTDVLILSQFLRPDGCLLPRRVTKVCSMQQKNLQDLVGKAQRAGLLTPFRPELYKSTRSERPRLRQYKFRKYNVHYEDTIYVNKKKY